MAISRETEASFQRTVVELARLHSWWVFHDADSRRNEAGLPDLILIRDGVIIAAELKSRTGKIRPAQARVLALLEQVAAKANGAVQVFTWRPADWDQITRTLA